jgi:4-hydroxybutyrate CoA-transferase
MDRIDNHHFRKKSVSLLTVVRNSVFALLFTTIHGAAAPLNAPTPLPGHNKVLDVLASEDLHCAKLLREKKSVGSSSLTDEATFRVLQELETFAIENRLPMKWLPFGPIDRRIDRLVVGIDYTDKAMVTKYMKTFYLDRSFGEGHRGTLALEFQSEAPNGTTSYVGGILRTDSDPDKAIYRFGKKDITWTTLDRDVFGAYGTSQATQVRFFSHLIGLSESEYNNVQIYLNSPAERGRAKSDNCVAWISSIELGKTCTLAPKEDRHHLFNVLGMARSSAHFEIGRRLIHAANERHRAILVFYIGARGREVFMDDRQLASILPPTPKTPYSSIIYGYTGEREKVFQALAKIPDGSKVFVPIAAGASPEGLDALMSLAATGKSGMDIHVLVNGVSAKALENGVHQSPDKVRLHALFLGGNARNLYSEGLISVIPGYLGDFTRFVADPAKPQFHYDAMLVRVSPPNNAGEHSLGPNQDMIMSIIRNRPEIKIVAEINPNIPFTRGANRLKTRQFVATFKSDTKLGGPTTVPLSQVEEAIGRNISTLITAGSTLQVGIGNIFGGLAKGIKDQGLHAIKIHTEMFGDHMREMLDNGSADSARAGFAFGSEDMYAWLGRTEKVTFEDTEVINDPSIIKNIPQFHAVNTALQINLRGEVNATHGPEGRISSPGGQVEFMSGASKSNGGKAIMAIRATAKHETISTITSQLYGPATTPAEMVTHVVTEYGVAHLAGLSESARAMALILIAHPKFRRELVDQALAQKLIHARDAHNLMTKPEFLAGGL